MILPINLLKKTWRDLKIQKFQVAALIVILGIGASIIVGFEHLAIWRRDALDTSYESLNMMDFQMNLLPNVFANISDVKARLNTISGIDAIEFRLLVNVGVNLTSENQLRIVQGRLFGINVTGIRTNSGTTRPDVNDYEIKNGLPLNAADMNSSNVILQQAFAHSHNLLPSQSFNILLANNSYALSIKGIGYFAEYFIVSSDDKSILSSDSQFAAIYLPLDTVQRFLFLPGKFNQIIVRTSQNPEEVQSQLTLLLQDLGYDTITLFRDDLATYNYVYQQVENDHETYQSIWLLFMFIAGLGTYIVVSRLITAQRRLIGISRSLGFQPRTLIGQYLLFSILIGFLGSILADFLGVILGLLYNDIFSEFVQLPFWPIFWVYPIFIFANIFCLVIVIIAGFIPTYRACRMPPIDAIRLDPFSDTASRTRPGIFSRLTKSLPFSISVKLPIRNILRNRRRTMSTIFALSFSVIISISLLGIFDSFDSVMEGVGEDLGDWNISAQSSGFESESVWESYLTSETLGFEGWEYSLELGVTLISKLNHKDVFLQSYHENSEIRSISLNEKSSNDTGIIISSRIAQDLDLKVGDILDVQHLLYGGQSGYYLDTTGLEVVGIHDSVISLISYMKIEHLRALINASIDVVNTIYLKSGDVSDRTTQNFLYQIPGIATTEFKDRVLADRQTDIDELRQILWPALVLSALFIFSMVMNTVSINVSERTRETGTMLALGTKKWVIARFILIENLFIGAISLLLGMICGQLVLEYVFIRGSIEESLPQLILPIIINSYSWGLVIAIFIGSISLAQIIGIRKAINLDLAVATKVLE